MINIVDILKDCPKGTKLYSPICGECRLIKIYDGLGFDVITDTDAVFNFAYDGRYYLNGECCIFPSKDNRDWNTFRPFKDGDIISNILTNSICIFKGEGRLNGTVDFYCGICCNEFFIKDNIDPIKHFGYIKSYHLATEKEKQKFFDDIKSKGYKWNAETKTLEKLIEPKFKVGDRIVHKENKNSPFTITEITEDCYNGGTSYSILIEQQDNFELVPNKFDISSLKPYDKVLVRDDNNSVWINTFFGFYNTTRYKKCPFVAGTVNWTQCIPYEGNEHLLGKCRDCDEYYKNW